MKKKLLAIIAAVAMIATLLVPMLAVSADEGKIVFALGEITYDASNKEIVVPLNIVEQTNVETLLGLFAAEICLASDQGLECTYIKKGTIADSYNDPREGKIEFGFNYMTNEAIGKLVIDSDWSDKATTYGVRTTGLVATFSYAAPEGFDVADLDNYTFSFAGCGEKNEPGNDGEDKLNNINTMMVCFKDNTVVPAVLLCKHTSTKEVVVKEATCEAKGEKKTVCNACGEDVKTGIDIPAKGHDMQEAPGTSATCTEGGTVVKVCANGCGKTETTQGAALGHDWVVDEDASEAATCDADGKKVEVCSRNCGVDAKETTIPKLGHNWVVDEDAYVAPTCTADGKGVEVCSRECGVDAKETTIPKLGHDFNGEIEIVKEATLDAEGEMKIGCTRCEETKTESIAKLVVEAKNDDFSIKTDDGKGIPADIYIVAVDPEDVGVKGIDGLDALAVFGFDSDTTNLEFDEVTGQIVVNIEGLDKQFENLALGVIDPATMKVTKVEATITSETITFKGNVADAYVLMGTEIEEKADDKPTNTNSADTFSVVLYVAAALVAAAGVVVIAKKRFAL